MISKKSEKELEEYFKTNAKGYATHEKIVKFLSKVPGVNVAKKIESLAKRHKVEICSSAEIAKMKNFAEAKQREQEKQKLQDTGLEKDFDLANESEILEWGRFDSPVRMYLREMGQISATQQRRGSNHLPSNRAWRGHYDRCVLLRALSHRLYT